METDLFNVQLDQKLASQQEVYHYLAREIAEQSKLSLTEIVHKFLSRERVGNIQVAERIIMPHFVAANVQNKIIVIRTLEMIPKWSDQIEEVQVILAIIMDSEAGKEEKLKLNHFLQNLMDPDFIRVLLNGDLQEICQYL